MLCDTWPRIGAKTSANLFWIRARCRDVLGRTGERDREREKREAHVQGVQNYTNTDCNFFAINAIMRKRKRRISKYIDEN